MNLILHTIFRSTDACLFWCMTSNWINKICWRYYFSSADDVSSAELMVLLIVRHPSSVVRRRPSSVVRRPSVNFCFKSLLLLQFLFDNSEFFTGETRHIVPPCNKAGISNFCLEFQKLQKFQIAEIPVKTALLINSYSIILKFYWRN